MSSDCLGFRRVRDGVVGFRGAWLGAAWCLALAGAMGGTPASGGWIGAASGPRVVGSVTGDTGVPEPATQETATQETATQETATQETATQESGTSVAAEESKSYLAITNVTLHTLEREGVIASGTVLIADGKLLAVGREVELPAGAEVIDGRGWHLTPGLIDVRSRLFLGPNSADQAATDGSLDGIDGVDRFNSYGDEVLAAGVTAVYLQPGAAGSLGGYGATVLSGSADRLSGDATEGVLQSPAGVQMALGGVSRAGTARARRQQYEALQKRLKDARDYQKAWDDYRVALQKQAESKAATPADKPAGESPANQEAGEAARGSGEAPTNRPRRRPGPPPQSAGDAEETTMAGVATEVTGAESRAFGVTQEPRPQRGGRPGGRPASGGAAGQEGAQAAAGEAADAAANEPKKPSFDPLKERLLPVLKRELPVRFEVRQTEEIEWALSLAKEFNLRLVLEGLSEMKSATAAVQAAQTPVVLGPWFDGAGSRSVAEATAAWGQAFGLAAKAPNRVVIATFSDAPAGSKWLRQHAAAAVAAGLSREQALRGVTLEAAHVAGVGEVAGSLRVGKRADLVLFAGDPLDVTAPVALVIQAGRVVHDRRNDLGPSAGMAEAEQSSVAVPSARGVAELPAVLPARYAIVSQRSLHAGGSWVSTAIVVEDGRVKTKVSPEELPGDLLVYDLGDMPITPGLQSAWWVNEAARTPISRDSNAAQQFALDGFDGEAAAVQRLRDSGVTAVQVVNGLDNVVAGQTAWVRLTDVGFGVREEGQRKVAAEQWVLTERSRSIERFPSTLVGQVAMLRDRLAGRGDATTLYLPEAAVEKLLAQRAAQLSAVQNGTLPVVVVAETDGEIDAVLRLVAGTKVQAWLYGPTQVRPFTERLASAGVGVIVSPVTESTYDWYLRDLVVAQSQGVNLCLSGRHGHELRATAAALVAAGLSREAARSLLVSEAGVAFDPNALVFGIGAPAEFVVWSGDPLDLTSRVIWTSWGKK